MLDLIIRGANLPDGRQNIDIGIQGGKIASVTEPFCSTCDRLRLTSDGFLRTCLFAHTETDLRTPMRSGATDEDLEGLVRAAVAAKGPGHAIGRAGFEQPVRVMSRIGG